MSLLELASGAQGAAEDRVRSVRVLDDPPPTHSPLLGRVVVSCATTTYLLRAVAQAEGDDGRVVELLPLYRPADRLAGPVIVEACDDPEHGSHHPAYLGLACSCDAYHPEGDPCEHLVAIAGLANALPRPAPRWGDDPARDNAVVELDTIEAFRAGGRL